MPLLTFSEALPIHGSVDRATAYQAKCDSNGDLYLPVMIDAENFGPIVRVANRGSKVTSYVYFDQKGAIADTRTFAITPSGDYVYVLVTKRSKRPTGEPAESKTATEQSFSLQPYLVRFSPDGTQLDEAALETPIIPLQAAVLADGSLIVAGLREIGPNTLRNFIGVFRHNGKLVRELTIPPEPIDLFATAYSTFEMDIDGNLYLIRRGSEGPVHVISPVGDVLRTVVFTTPKGTRLLTGKAARNNFVAVSAKVVPTETPGAVVTEKVVVSVIDPHNGEIRAQYDASDRNLGIANLVCYQANTFTALRRSTDGEVEIVRSTAK
jgi:hypothetical protein